MSTTDRRPRSSPSPPTARPAGPRRARQTRTRSWAPHPHEGGVTDPGAQAAGPAVVVRHGDGTAYELEHEHEGVWVGVLPGTEVPDYRLEVDLRRRATRTSSTTRTGSCRRSARWTCT